MWHHIASDSNIMTQMFMKRLLQAWLIQFEFQIPRQSIQSVIAPITRVNRKSQHITPDKLLSVSKIVAEFKPTFPSKSRITMPKARCLPKLMKAKHYK
jgi:hypothetical protein